MQNHNEPLSSSLEDYLETIFHLVSEHQVARAKDIAQHLGVKSPSVTGALRALAKRDLINYSPYDVITLTEEGHAIAREVVRRHEVLHDFFVKVLGVSDREADEAACKMEHLISRTILERFIEFVAFLEVCPRGGETLLEAFRRHCGPSTTLENCDRCVSGCLSAIREREEEQPRTGPVPTLAGLDPGQKGRIVRIRLKDIHNKQIAEMRVAPGMLVEVEHVDAEEGTTSVKIRGYHVDLRQEELEAFDVQAL